MTFLCAFPHVLGILRQVDHICCSWETSILMINSPFLFYFDNKWEFNLSKKQKYIIESSVEIIEVIGRTVKYYRNCDFSGVISKIQDKSYESRTGYKEERCFSVFAFWLVDVRQKIMVAVVWAHDMLIMALKAIRK